MQTTQELAKQYATNATANTANDTNALLAQYEKIAEQQKGVLEGQRNLANTQINSQRDEVMNAYNDNARQAYINYMLGRKTAQKDLAEAGLSTNGVVASAYSNLENAYGNNLGNLQTNRDKSINDINKQLNESNMQYDIQAQKLASDLENAKLELQKYGNELAYRKYQDALQNYMLFANYDYNKAVDDRKYNYNKAIDDRNYEYNKAVDDRNYNYQVLRDNILDDQWQKEYELALKKANSSSRASGSSAKDKDYSLVVPEMSEEELANQIMANVQILQGPGITKNIKDGLTGKTYSSMDELFASYDLAYVK